MIIKNKLLKRGFSVNLFKGASIEYQEGIWENLDKEKKEIISNNLVYLKLSPYSMFLDKEICFDFSMPYLKGLSDKGIMNDIPRIAEEDNTSTKKLIEKFKNKKISFRDNNTGLINDIETNDSALIGMSFGKDSLLSYGIAKELNLKPKLVMIQDFWDKEADHKFKLMENFEDEFDEEIDIIYDVIDDMHTYKKINKTNSEGIVGTNAMNSYITMFLPLAVKYQTKYLVFGNEKNFNDYFINKEGFKVYPSHEQSSKWMREQNTTLRQFTSKKIAVSSFVEPLYNIAEIKVLFNRYPKIAKYQMSCDLIGTRTKKEKWCHNCPMCAKAFLYLTVNSINPKRIDFKTNFFDKKFKKFYPLFNKRQERVYEKPPAVRDEQLFAFYLAYKNKIKGGLVDEFRKKFLNEATEREDELYNKFFKVHDAVSLPGKIKNNIKSIYKEELNK